MDPISMAISAGSNLVGGLLNSSSAKKTNEAMLADKQRDRDLQMSFAQSGIQWKVNDAKQAGIHPLYALGASTPTYTPSSLQLNPTNPGTGIAAAGQDISRAINATRSAGQRTDAFTKTVQDLTLQKMGLENQLLGSQIAKLNQTQNPPMPVGQRYLIDGQGQTASGDTPATFAERFGALVQDKPMERTRSAPGLPHQEPGAINDVGFARTAGGGYAAVPSKDVKERIEDNLIQEVLWSIRNNIMPSIGFNESPPPVPVPKGYAAWRYHPFYQEYRPHKKGWGGIHY